MIISNKVTPALKKRMLKGINNTKESGKEIERISYVHFEMIRLKRE